MRRFLGVRARVCAYVTDTPTKVQMIFNVIRCSGAGYWVPIITLEALKMALAGC
jgi:hypothetical protein